MGSHSFLSVTAPIVPLMATLHHPSTRCRITGDMQRAALQSTCDSQRLGQPSLFPKRRRFMFGHTLFHQAFPTHAGNARELARRVLCHPSHPALLWPSCGPMVWHPTQAGPPVCDLSSARVLLRVTDWASRNSFPPQWSSAKEMAR